MIREEVLSQLSQHIQENFSLLKPVGDSWQPSDLLPNLTGDGWQDELKALRQKSKGLPDDLLVVLVGNLVTEEALPSYQTWLNRVDGLRDETGVCQTPWAIWTRAWTAEENRHGDVLNRYLYLTGRVDMRRTEVTVQNLIRNGFDVGSGKDPYQSVVYASFQERATKISHLNTGKFAEKMGEDCLAKICLLIGADEARHEEAYKRFFGKILEIDPSEAVLAFAKMMKQRISMPAKLMTDGVDTNLFDHFAIVAQKTNVYTFKDYALILQHLLEFWRIPHLKGLTGDAAKAQEYLCQLPERYLDKVESLEAMLSELPPSPFSWIFQRAA